MSCDAIQIDPLDGPEEIVELVLSRFIVEARKWIPERMGHDVEIVLTTHTEYFDPQLGGQVVNVPVEEKTKRAQVPSIALSDRWSWERNKTLFKNQYQAIPTRFKGALGKQVDGVTVRNPVEIVDLTSPVRLYHNTPQLITKLQRVFFQYLDLYPYLFIPADQAVRNPVTDDGQLQRLIQQWFAYPDKELEIPGFFVGQAIPNDRQVFSTNLRANRSNIFVGETNLALDEIPLPDGANLGKKEFFRAYQVEFEDMDNEEFSETVSEGTLTEDDA